MRYICMKTFVHIFLTAVLALMPLSLRAETVSQKQASKIAQTFFNAAYGEYVAAPKMVWNGRQLTTDRLFAPFYVYNHPRGGFVIISAENKAFPVLGYSRTGKFDKDRLTDEERELMKQYAHEIEMIRYDSRTPERAITAWQQMPQYLYDVIADPYNSPEFRALTDEVQEEIEQIDRRNGWVMMPSAVEFNIYNPERWRDYTLDDVLAEEEYVPFSLYEDFIREIAEEDRARQAALDEIISPTRPVLTRLGGAHFKVRYPEEVTMTRVYGLDGMRYHEKYWRDTDTASLDLSNLPVGYYALMALGKSGKVYGIKIAR